MVGPSSQISKLLLFLLLLLIIFYLAMDVQLYIRIHFYPIERSHNINKITSLPWPSIQNDPNNKMHNADSYDDYNSEKNIGNVFSSKSNKILSNNGNIRDGNHYIYQLVTSSQNILQAQQRSIPIIEKSILESNEHDTSNSTNDLLSGQLQNETFDIISKFNKKTTFQNVLATQQYINENEVQKYKYSTWIPCHINPLCFITVKALLLDHTNHYLFAPMATIFDDIIGFSRTQYITANFISYFHVFVALIAARFIASDYLGYRRIGVLLFEFRTFLDDLDGHVARVKKNIQGERSEVGTAGYYIDGLCDSLGCVALMIGIYIFLKNNPPRRGYAQMQAVLPVTNDETNCNTIKLQSEIGVTYRVKTIRQKIVKKVCIFSGQLLFSSMAWNRYIASYQNMLECDDVTPIQLSRQNFVFKSNIFFLIAWLWRLFNVHSILHCLLLSIFCDKLWDFLKMIQYSGILILFLSMCATEMHVLEAQNFIFNSMIIANNNTSL
ncbi:ceramide phosphoethanolamine synthase [Condylostylus longicornis]|uniref:ceramide phosphoethanolamine synthase n=1 Tax=Condylostylus longicornis TaxID=2530218 RepID=UPI00244DBF57|nr:ceramide phosphoethanolamine synthase [Condylostylus longicornis]XP_055378292.1 ceramide phosphoethanolamine synthase [Condylostylus longicornis]XP_055378368.1 ceramide phosphoethanolamine synthase [Condylostylus longicornis]XP_055378454.1 ceramide phosphoethanolamine synthase [Condylostylus longicornis]XP_055378540.1 ceramide phosphoethanolamine synthase [Condylostylus longicornis]